MLRSAKAGGLTEQQFTQCLRDDEALTALNARVESAAKDDKITGTPTFVVNGKKVGEGEQTLAQLEAAIAEAEKAAK